MKIGDKVLCVIASFRGRTPREISVGVTVPVVGEIYTIRTIDADSIRLEEIINPELQYQNAFGELRFKKIRFILWNPEEEMIELLKNKEKQKN
jgi:hypothetical protein